MERRAGWAVLLLLVSGASCAGIADYKDRAIDFFSLLKNHLIPQTPAAVSPTDSPAHRTELRGNCKHEYYAITAGQPLTVKSTNYPGPYPPGECRKMVLVPGDVGTAVVLVCTDVDTAAIGVLGEVTGDMLEFPGPEVNRRAHQVYGVDVTQCGAVPFMRRTAPGQAMKVGFFSDDFVQRRGFSCQAWGEGGSEREAPNRFSVQAPHPQHHGEQQHHGNQQRPPASQHFPAHLSNPQFQFNQQQQQQQQQQQYDSQQQYEITNEEPVEVYQETEPEAPTFSNPALSLSDGFSQVIGGLGLGGFVPQSGPPLRRPAVSSNRPLSQANGFQAFANLFGGRRRKAQSGNRQQARPSFNRGPRPNGRPGRTGKRLHGNRGPPFQQGRIRFPGSRHKRSYENPPTEEKGKRSFADLLKKRILAALSSPSPVSPAATSVVPDELAQSRPNGQTSGFRPPANDPFFRNNAIYEKVVEPVEELDSVDQTQSNGFKPPENIEYIITPIRVALPHVPGLEGNRPMFHRVPVTANTTESPVVEVPYSVTPRAVALRATTDRGELVTGVLSMTRKAFPTTPKLSIRQVTTEASVQPEGTTTLPISPSTGSSATAASLKPDILKSPAADQTDPEDVLEKDNQSQSTTPTNLDEIDSVDNGESHLNTSSSGSIIQESVSDPSGDRLYHSEPQPIPEQVTPVLNVYREVERADHEPILAEGYPEATKGFSDTQERSPEAAEDTRDGEGGEQCGRAGPAVQARVFGGEDALPGSYPWVVYLISDAPQGPEKKVYCTGSLISRQWIITAAHCIDYAKTTDVHMGYLDVSKETNLTLRITANKYWVHPYWSRLTKEHDMGLIQLPEEVPMSEHVRPICLPRRSQAGNTYQERRAEICGWGKTYTDQVGGSFVLQRAEIAIRSNCDCIASFPINITPLKICSHGRYHSPCQGDSGGPLQVRGAGGRYTLVGVSSFTSALGCDVGMPAIYTRITAYLDWIADNSGLVLPL